MSSTSSQDIATSLKNDKRISFYEKLRQMGSVGRRRDSSKERSETAKDSRKCDAQKAKIPISSSLAAMNVAVKLRQNGTRQTEDG